MVVKLIVSYDGTNYCGWQVQPNGITVQEELEKALFCLTGEKISVTGSGRTDAGVHAQGQVASFKTEKDNIPPENYCQALNTVLPADIKVLSSNREEDNFNARFSAKKKTYVYSMYQSKVVLPLKDRYSVRVNGLDTEKMKEASALFVGEKDFKCFCAANSSVKDTVRKVYSLDVETCNNDIKIKITGNGFLYNMVRIIAGTLVAVGEGKLSKTDVEKILQGKDRSLAGKTLPAKGLTLECVEY